MEDAATGFEVAWSFSMSTLSASRLFEFAMEVEGPDVICSLASSDTSQRGTSSNTRWVSSFDVRHRARGGWGLWITYPWYRKKKVDLRVQRAAATLLGSGGGGTQRPKAAVGPLWASHGAKG